MGLLSKLSSFGKKKVTDITQPEKVKPPMKKVKTRNIKSIVEGLDQKEFKEFSKALDEKKYFKNKYEGMSNKTLLEEELYDMEFWEITGTSVPFVGIEPEGEAIAILWGYLKRICSRLDI